MKKIPLTENVVRESEKETGFTDRGVSDEEELE
jgi:hypothetical protein